MLPKCCHISERTMNEITEVTTKNRGGAPRGNANRTKSGKRAWCAVKRLPKSSGLIRQQLYAERDEIEAAVCRQHGEISLFHAALVQSALRHSGRAQLLERWLRIEADLPLNERLAVLREIGSASDSRDKCLQRLGLDQTQHSDPWAVVDAMHASGGGWKASADGSHEIATSGGPRDATASQEVPAVLPAGDGNATETGTGQVAAGSPGAEGR